MPLRDKLLHETKCERRNQVWELLRKKKHSLEQRYCNVRWKQFTAIASVITEEKNVTPSHVCSICLETDKIMGKVFDFKLPINEI